MFGQKSPELKDVIVRPLTVLRHLLEIGADPKHLLELLGHKERGDEDIHSREQQGDEKIKSRLGSISENGND